MSKGRVIEEINLWNLFTPRYYWNTAKTGVLSQFVNQST
jgi:hypothetical protein